MKFSNAYFDTLSDLRTRRIARTVMVMTEDQIREHAIIFERDTIYIESDSPMVLVNLFGLRRWVGLTWAGPLNWGQFQAILGNVAQVGSTSVR